MPDDKRLRQKVVLETASSPAVVIPPVLGMTALIFTWAVGFRPDLGLLAAVAGFVIAAGVYTTKLLLGGDVVAKSMLSELREEEKAERETELDDLEQRLSADGDSRTEAALHDLRTFERAFKDMRDDSELKLNARSAYDILAGVDKLFEQCVHTLEQTLNLWYTAKDMKTKAARGPILSQREEMLEDVGEGIQRLGHLLATIQDLGADEDGSEIERLGQQLDQNLETARQVEQRIKDFEADLEPGQYE